MTWGMITDSVCCVCVYAHVCVCVSPSVYACIYVTGPDKTSLIYTKLVLCDNQTNRDNRI